MNVIHKPDIEQAGTFHLPFVIAGLDPAIQCISQRISVFHGLPGQAR